MESLPPPPTLLSLIKKEKVMKKIFENLDFKAIMTLRKVCQPLRTFLKDTLPDAPLISISMDVEAYDTIHLYCVDKEFIREVEYSNQGDGVNVLHGEFEAFLENMDFEEAFSRDLKVILEHQISILPNFGITFSGISENTDKFFKALGAVLRALGAQLKVQQLEVQLTKQAQLMEFLPSLDPSSLKHIVLAKPFNMSDQEEEVLRIDKISELEQWENAENLNAKQICTSAPLEHFMHFTTAEVSREMVKAEELIAVKEKLFVPSNLRLLNINFGAFPESQKFMDHLGTASASTEDATRAEWYFKIQGGQDQVMSIHLYKMAVDFMRVNVKDLPGIVEIRD